MIDYISREAAVKEYCLNMCGHEYEADLCGKCNYPLHNVPSADVREVVKSKWGKEMTTAECCHCGSVFPAFLRLYSFCPNCGADMREAEA